MAPAPAEEKATLNSLGPINFGPDLRRHAEAQHTVDVDQGKLEIDSRRDQLPLEHVVATVLSRDVPNGRPGQPLYDALAKALKEGAGAADFTSISGNNSAKQVQAEFKSILGNAVLQTVYAELTSNAKIQPLLGPEAERQERVNALSQKLAQGMVEVLTESRPLEIATRQIKYTPGQHVSVVIDAEASGGQVTIVNERTQVKTTFTAPAEGSADRGRFIELLSRLKGEKAPSPSLLRPDEEVPSLDKVIKGEDLFKVYQLLNKYSGGLANFALRTERSADTIMRDLDRQLASATGLIHRVSGLELGDPLVQDITAEHTACRTDGSHDPRFQRANVTASEEICCTRAVPRAGAAIGELKITNGLGGYAVELTTRMLGGARLKLVIGIDMDTRSSADLKRLAETFESDKAKSLDDSSTMKLLMTMGAIKSIEGVGRDANVSGVNWLGKHISKDAVIKNINFSRSNLDLTGSGVTLENCTFRHCLVNLQLKEAKLSDCIFDKDTVVSGRLTGKMDLKCQIRGNALRLDFREVEIGDGTFERYAHREQWEKTIDAQHKLRHMFKGAILNRNTIPKALQAVATKPVSEALLRIADKKLDEQFSGRAAQMRILNALPPEIPHAYRPATADNKAFFDFYPPGLTPPAVRDPIDPDSRANILRVFTDRDQSLAFVYGPEHEVATLKDWEAAKKAAAEKKLKFGFGNLKTFQTLLDFIHLDFAAINSALDARTV